MKGELSTKEYCGRYSRPHQHCDVRHTNGCIINGQYCEFYHRKYPTPEQFQEEYKREIPKDFPVWLIIPDGDNFPDWTLVPYADALQYEHEEQEWADFEPTIYIVYACTPWGKPDKDWRPE
jgi:hypothetical protein